MIYKSEQKQHMWLFNGTIVNIKELLQELSEENRDR